LTNSIVWNCGQSIELLNDSTLAVGHCVVQGATNWPGPANVAADPQFADPAAGDYRLRPGSPALDSGVALPWMADAVDLDGRSRVWNGAPDRGAYEFYASNLVCNFVADTAVGQTPLSVAFTAFAAGGETDALHYAWDFDGDGAAERAGASWRAATWIYTNAGRYSPVLAVSNAAGEMAQCQRPDYITVQGPSRLYVSSSGLHRPPFATWEDAATNIHSAVAAAFAGSEILVADGVYRLSAPLVLNESLTLRAAGSPFGAVLDGGGGVRCLDIRRPDALAEGFTVRNGFAADGGGIYLSNGIARACRLEHNTALRNGGGACLSGAARLEDCVIVSNTVRHPNNGEGGGGVFATGNAVVRRCWIQGNVSSTNDGGGVELAYGGTVVNSVLTGNRAFDKGGGAFLWYGGRLQNCVVVGNTAAGGPDSGGGGVRCFRGGAVWNTIIWSNSSPREPNYFLYEGGDLRACCTVPLPPVGSGHVTNDPALRDPAAGDYRLRAASPCLDAGADDGAPADDFDGLARPLDGNADGTNAFDIGAFEYLDALADSDRDGLPDAWEIVHGLDPRISTGADGPSADPDGDGSINFEEYQADTDPADPSSALRLTGATTASNRISLTWQGGVAARQWLEWQAHLTAPQAWTAIATQHPPTPVIGQADHPLPPTGGYYRLRASRPTP